jgi:deoxyribose-phosphate aldolase
LSVSARELARAVDHTLLKPDATERDVVRLCEEAARYGFAAVCVPPCYVGLCAEELRGSEVEVATVVSFPFGADSMAVKRAAIRDAIAQGASELDVVMNISRFLSGDYGYVAEEVSGLVEEVASSGGGARPLLKVILEIAYLTEEQKRVAAGIVAESGADFVKTSTGFGPGGATAGDVALLRGVVPEEVGVKASGGIRTLRDALEMLDAGASRLGMSGSVAVMEEALGGALQE